MIEVSKVNNIGAAQAAKKKTSASGANFADFLDVGEAEETQKSTPAQNLSALNFLNEVEDNEERKKKKKQTIEHGRDILEDLTRIQNGLLVGGLSKTQLMQIQNKIARHKLAFIDHKLDFIINEIEVRAAVELAKFGVF